MELPASSWNIKLITLMNRITSVHRFIKLLDLLHVDAPIKLMIVTAKVQ